MCWSGSAGQVNSRGDTLAPDEGAFGQVNDALRTFTGGKKTNDQQAVLNGFNPAKRAEFLSNWLTAGGPPKPLDPSKIFGEKQAMSGVYEKSGAGAGISGLFGAGLLVGDLAAKPLNLSPMQTGVGYSAAPAPNLIGGK